jgi:hypothetical protein
VFWREDDTGRVAIDPEGTDVTPSYKDVWRSRASLAGFASKPAHTVNFLTNHASGNRYRFTEELLNPGDELYAIGLLKNLGSHLDTTTIDAEVRQLLHEWKKDQATLKQRFDCYPLFHNGILLSANVCGLCSTVRVSSHSAVRGYGCSILVSAKIRPSWRKVDIQK